MANVIELEYRPREHFIPFHERDQRFACMVAHRRAGKTVACVNELIERASYSKKKRARYGYVGPYYSQTKEIAWTYLKDYATPLLAKKPSESELAVVLKHNGAKIQLYGADNPDRLRGMYFDGVILDEYGDMKPSVWSKVILPTLADRKGWAVFIGTPKGKNHFYKIFRRSKGMDLTSGEDPEAVRKAWFNFVLRASESFILSDDELAMQRAEMSEDEYLQEFECSFDAAVLGTYFASTINMIESKGQINSTVQWDPEFPVFVAMDIGYTDSTAIWFWQERPDGIAIIDFEEAHSQPLAYYFDILKSLGYKYDTIWLPHDAKAKSLQTGRSTVEQFLDAGFPVRITPNLSLQHGVDAARLVLPNCYFNSEKCGDGIEALRAYRRRWDEDKKVFSPEPVHDWASHPSDAFRYLSLVAKERIVRATEKRIEVVTTPQITLDSLWADHTRKLRNRSRWQV